MTDVPEFEQGTLEAICNVLGDTNEGLSGTEIGQLLGSVGIRDAGPNTKRYRLMGSLSTKQEEDGCGDAVLRFIEAAMDPVRYVGFREAFERRKSALNQALAFAGYEVGDNGQVSTRDVASTLEEAQDRAAKLHRALMQRNVHPDVLRFCQAEWLQDNYFHAVFEATKSVADKIRQKTGLDMDGSNLVDAALGGDSPLLAINARRDKNERSEQTGFLTLLKGMFGVFRNTTAHAPKISWPISEQDALDLMSLASYMHRRLDSAPPASV